MAIKAGLRMVVFDSTTQNSFDPSDQMIDEDELKRYLEENKYPEDPEYTEKEFVSDMIHSSGLYSIPMGAKPETVDFIVECLNKLI